MAREEKRVELRPVDEVIEPEVAVIRLESDDTSQRAKPIRLPTPSETQQVSQRLDLPAREEYEVRTHQPGIEALIEAEMVSPDFLEQDWGSESTRHRSIPWGWFVLIGLILAGGVLWSLYGVKEGESRARELRVASQTAIIDDAEEDLEAGKLIERIESATRGFFSESGVESLARRSRHSERVLPLMEAHYGGKTVPVNRLKRITLLQPLTLDNRANFWMETAEFADGSSRNLIVEVMENGEPKIDWETFICHQPMKWDTYALERPAGSSLDFRVYIEPDTFFSHEFADSTQWTSFRLTALDSDETLFGYVKTGDPVFKDISAILERNQGRRTSMILRLNVPAGIQSRRGVVIEKLLSPRWLYIDEPNSGS